MKMLSGVLLAALTLGSGVGAAEEEPRITRVFCWGYPVSDEAAKRYAAAGVTDMTVRDRKEYDFAVKYGITPYASCFFAVGPHRQQMTPEEEAYSAYINGQDLAADLPRAEKMKIIHRRRAEKKHRWGGEPETELDTLRCDIPCFGCDTDLELSKKSVDKILERAVPGVKGIYLDYIGYTNHRGCYCAGCLERLKQYLAERKLADTQENRDLFYRDELVNYYNRVIGYIRSRRPDLKIVVHLYPDFRPDPLFGNRVDADFCGQTVAWYFKWPHEKIARYTRFVVEHAKDYHPGATGIPFLGVNSSRNTSLGFKTPEEVEAELRTIIGASGRMLMVCNGPVMIEPGYFEVFEKYCGPR